MKTSRRHIRILIVDEKSGLSSSIIRHLRRAGFSIESSVNDVEARRRIVFFLKTRRPFKMVIHILQNRQSAGIEFIEWLHRHHPYISVIVISSLGNADWIGAYLNPSQDVHIQNPLTPEELSATIGDLEARLQHLTQSDSHAFPECSPANIRRPASAGHHPGKLHRAGRNVRHTP